MVAAAAIAATCRHRRARRVSEGLILDRIAPSFPTQPDKPGLNLTEVPSAVGVGLGNTADVGGYRAVWCSFGAWCGFRGH